MLFEVDGKIVSTQLLDEEFVCNLSACKGACCIHGDAGAPLTLDEVDQLEENIEKIKPFISEAGKNEIEKNGVFYMDQDNEPVTTLINGGECAFVYRDEKGTTLCGIEEAERQGKIDFKKPISCALYPIRVKKFEKLEALNYDKWDICSDACTLGKELQVPVYKFLKAPIIRAFGESFYNELDLIKNQLSPKTEN